MNKFITLTHALTGMERNVRADTIFQVNEKRRVNKETGEVQVLTLIVTENTSPFYVEETPQQVLNLLENEYVTGQTTPLYQHYLGKTQDDERKDNN